MPQAIVAGAAWFAAASVATQVAVVAGLAVAAVGVGNAIVKSLAPDLSASNEVDNNQSLNASGTPNERMIVGSAVVSGQIIKYAKVNKDKEQYHHLFIPLANHPCEAVLPYQLDGKAMSSLTGNGYYIEPRLGNQTAALARAVDSMPNVDETFIGYGMTDIYCEIKIDPDVFPNGLQDLKMLVKGHKFYDPRKDSSIGGSGAHRLDDESTWEWTDNPALILFYWKKFGDSLELPTEMFDLTNIAAEANICDELVDYVDQDGVTRQQKRFTCNGTIDLTTGHEQVETKLLESCAGKWAESTAGQFRLIVGSFRGPATLTITDEHLAGSPKRRPTVALSDRCNKVKCSFISKHDFYQSTDMTPLTSTFLKDNRDNGRVYEHDLQLLYTNDNATTQRIANIHLNRNAAGDYLSLPLNSIGLFCTTGTVLNIDLKKRGITGLYEVEDCRFDIASRSFEVNMRETSAAMYSQGNVPALSDLTPNDIIDNTVVEPVTNIEFTQTVLVYKVGHLTWSHPVPSSVIDYRIDIRNSSNELIEPSLFTKSPFQNISGLNVGDYTATISASNAFNKHSEPVVASFTIDEVANALTGQFLFGDVPPTPDIGNDGQRYVLLPIGLIYLKVEGQWEENGNLNGDKFLTGTTDPTNELGKDGDFYFKLPEWLAWQKVNGAWVSKGKIRGDDGKSAYQTWLDLGNSGNEADFIAFLNAKDGVDGNTWHVVSSGAPSSSLGKVGDFALSAGRYVYYKVDATQWLFQRDLLGPRGFEGRSAYQVWLDQGNSGTEADFIEYLNATDGEDGNTWHVVSSGAPSSSLGKPGDLALSAGRYVYFKVDNVQWIYQRDLLGPRGFEGRSAYQIWLDQGNSGSETDFIEYLNATDGEDGNTWHDVENGVPSSSLGKAGDYALSSDRFVYYKVNSNTWVYRRDLLGPAGKSAYQEWLEQGNSGTEADFINYLNATDGEDGNTWHIVTSGQPSNSLGRSGDFALSAGRYVYYKSGNTWQYRRDLRGPEGPQGPIGPPGIPGADSPDAYTDEDSSIGSTSSTAWKTIAEVTVPSGLGSFTLTANGIFTGLGLINSSGPEPVDSPTRVEVVILNKGTGGEISGSRKYNPSSSGYSSTNYMSYNYSNGGAGAATYQLRARVLKQFSSADVTLDYRATLRSERN